MITKEIIFDTSIRNSNFRFHSTWGLFSPEHIDEGTALLINELDIKESDTCLDLGCGYGAIGIVMGKFASQGKIHMVDKDFVAVEYAKKNAEANGLKNTESYLSNGFSNISADIKFDLIASNLPAKPSKELYQILFDDAKKYLKPGGKFYVVVIAGLKEFIKRSFKEIFGNCEKLKQGRAHCVFVAVR